MRRISCIVALLQFANASVLPICVMADSKSGEKIGAESKTAWGEATDGLAISIVTPRAVYGPHERIVLTISLKNVSNDDKRIGQTSPLTLYDVEVLAPGKNKTPFTSYGKNRLENSREAGVRGSVLRPGEVTSVDIDLNRLFDLTLPGPYTVSVQRVVGKTGASDRVLRAISNTITVTIDETP